MLALCMTYLDAQDDKRRFEEIYLAYRKQMAALATSMLHNAEDAQDVVADVFLRIAQRRWEVVRDIEDPTDLRNYLLKATKHTALNKLKADKRARPVESVDEIDRLPDCSEAEFLDAVCNRLAYREVVRAISSLGETYRDALYYRYVLELSAPQIAEELGQSLAATKKQLVRGKKLLLNLLAEEAEHHDDR